MRRMVTATGVVVMAMLLMSPAFGKGPSGVTIDGPGLEEPITIEGNGEHASGSDFGRFVALSGFWPLVFGADPTGSGLGTHAEPTPKGLGVRYAVSWHLGRARIPASVYPDAAGGPWVHVVPGLSVEGFDTVTVGGWFAAPVELSVMLHEYRTALADEAARAPLPAPSLRASTEGADRGYDPMATNHEPQAAVAPARSARSGVAFDERWLSVAPVAASAALVIVVATWWFRRRAAR